MQERFNLSHESWIIHLSSNLELKLKFDLFEVITPYSMAFSLKFDVFSSTPY